GVERMTFLMLGVLQARGARVHCIVNGWENFRITPLAEEIHATWSVGPYWHSLTRRRLTPAKVAKMAWEIGRVSIDLLREARRLRATDVFVPDFLTTLRNGPALLWVRARGVDATLDVVGDMDGWAPIGDVGYRAGLRERAGRHDLSGVVAFLGHREDVPTLMSRASVHCCPSRPEIREAFGLVVLEAK